MRPTRTVFWPGFAAVSIFAATLLVALTECSCASNPVAEAQTLEQKAYALYGTFVILEEQADQVVKQSTTPENVRAAIANADAKAKPTADALMQSFLNYSHIEQQFKNGTYSQAELDLATQNLSKSVDKMGVDVQTLNNAVKQGEP